MERTPTEIWCHIYARACTDGGATGRSLALVSRRVRETSKHYRLQSISLHGHRQAIQFALMLDCTPMEERQIVDLSVQFDGDATQLVNPDEWTYPRVYQRMTRTQKVFENISHINPITKYYRVDHSTFTSEGLDEQEKQIERGIWRNDQYEKEFISAVNHILLHLHYRPPLRTLTLRAGPGTRARAIPWVGWYIYASKLDSWIIEAKMSWSTFLGMRYTGARHSTIRFLDIMGVGDGWGGDRTKCDAISHIAQFAPSLEYLRFTVSAVMVENLPPSQWLFDDALGSTSGCVSLPNTIKMVFVQKDMEFDEGRGSPLQTEYERLVESLKNIEDDHRVEVLECSDRTLSLHQLVDRLQGQ